MLKRNASINEVVKAQNGLEALNILSQRSADPDSSKHINIILLDDQDYRSSKFGVEVFVLWTCCKVVHEMVVGKDALHRLIAEENGSEFLW